VPRTKIISQHDINGGIHMFYGEKKISSI